MNKRPSFLALFLCLIASATLHAAVTVKKLNPTTVEVLQNGQTLTLDFYGPNIVRLFLDPQGGIVRDPQAQPPAQILVDQPRRDIGELTLAEDDHFFRIQTGQLIVSIARDNGLMTFSDRKAGRIVARQQHQPLVPEAQVHADALHLHHRARSGGWIAND